MSPASGSPDGAAARIAAHALGKPGAWADQPWEGDHVAKVGEKIFAFLGGDAVGVKAGKGRAEADEWLAEYPDDTSVMAYIGRNGWNTLRIGGAIPEDALLEAVDTSYALVVGGLPKSRRPEGWDVG
ncbi:MmcQ/YjbR family DNA-binding protein [Oryzobacter telluris]|uniref:MmcQ/YjbR family DNA-binding protein n=1 Tax=Oryzobacter telluris TaxID=3149179 RepID=UPI00370D1B81